MQRDGSVGVNFSLNIAIILNVSDINLRLNKLREKLVKPYKNRLTFRNNSSIKTISR